MKRQLIEFYLTYVNDFLTIARYAEWNEMSIADTEYLIEIGRKYFDGNLNH